MAERESAVERESQREMLIDFVVARASNILLSSLSFAPSFSLPLTLFLHPIWLLATMLWFMYSPWVEISGSY